MNQTRPFPDVKVRFFPFLRKTSGLGQSVLMKRRLSLRFCVAAVALWGAFAPNAHTQGAQSGSLQVEYIDGRPVAAGEVLVRLRSDAITGPQLPRAIDADDDRPVGHRGWRRLHSAFCSVQSLLAMLAARSDVLEVQANYSLHTPAVP